MRKRRRQRDFQRTVSLSPLQKGQVPDQKKEEESQGNKEAQLWVEPLETLPVCKNKICRSVADAS
jgi:hypothetical protein